MIIKNLQSENERLRQKLSIIILKPIKICSASMAEGTILRYQVLRDFWLCRTNSLEEKVVSVFSNIGVRVTSDDIEACHKIGKSGNNSEKQLFDLPIEKLPNKLSSAKR